MLRMYEDALVASASGKETRMTFFLKVSSSPSGRKGEVNSRPSSSLWPMRRVRDLS